MEDTLEAVGDRVLSEKGVDAAVLRRRVEGMRAIAEAFKARTALRAVWRVDGLIAFGMGCVCTIGGVSACPGCAKCRSWPPWAVKA